VTNAHSQDTRDGGFFIGVIVGGVVGASLAMYFAPRAASEFRRRMSSSARNFGDGATEWHQRASARVSDAVGGITRNGQAVRDEVADTVARGAREVELIATAATPNRGTRLRKKLSAADSRATRRETGQE
jgi:gas vesicle protein